MKINAKIRNEWIMRLFSTQAADRPRANSAVGDLYLAASFQPPQHFLWFDSPFQASWAVALLLRSHSAIWRQTLESTERSSSGRQLLARASEDVCRQVGASSWDVAVTAVGRPLGQHWVQPDFSQGFPKLLQTPIVSARMQLYDNDTGELFALLPESDDLVRAESHFAIGSKAVLATQVEWYTTGPIRTSSFLADYPFSKMAADESQAVGRSAPNVLSAAWSVGDSAGLWWPFSHAAVLTDRPAEIYYDERLLLHRADGPAVVYRDATKVYAWHGMSLREQWILDPGSISSGELKHLPSDFRKFVEARFGKAKPASRKSKTSSIFKAELPTDPALRLQRLREHAGGSLPFFERYMTGDHTKVWSDLVGLGAAVREDPNAADALAVAYETMRRVERNVRTVVERLLKMNYAFRTSGMALDTWAERAEALTTIDPTKLIIGDANSPHLQKLLNLFSVGRERLANQVAEAKRTPKDHTIRAFVPASGQVRKQIAGLEKMVGSLPLSLRAFYEVVGAVDWIGTHPSLAPDSNDTCPDPLVIFSIEDALEEAEQEMEDGEGFITIAPDDLHKADTSGGDPYQIAVPEPRADGELLNERHHLFFVDFLRLCFRFGGFPGYEGIDRGVPAEIAALAEGLLDF